MRGEVWGLCKHLTCFDTCGPYSMQEVKGLVVHNTGEGQKRARAHTQEKEAEAPAKVLPSMLT
jgi:hypothetical protein